jgi:eukaryotic-like serine/threonine-protein kinase
LEKDIEGEELKNIIFTLKLAFWLARPYVISEKIDELLQMSIPHAVILGNALFCLIELGSLKLAQVKLEDMVRYYGANELSERGLSADLLAIALSSGISSLEYSVDAYLNLKHPVDTWQSERVLFFLMESALDEGKTGLVHTLYTQTENQIFSTEGRLSRDAFEVWALLLEKEWSRAGDLLHQYPLELLSQETTILHFLYGCWLYVTEGKELAYIHFSGVFEVAYPRTWALFSYYLRRKAYENQEWLTKSFLWERRQLFRQLALFYFCAGEESKSLEYLKRAKAETIDVNST